MRSVGLDARVYFTVFFSQDSLQKLFSYTPPDLKDQIFPTTRTRSVVAHRPRSSSYVPASSHWDFCNQRLQQWPQNGGLLHFGIVTQYMQDTGSIIIMQCFGCEATRMPTESSGIPISLLHGSSPHGVLPWNSLAYEAWYPWNSQGQHMARQESPYTVSHLKSPGQPLHNSNRTQTSTRENEALYEEEELESDSDDEVECDLSNMEITELRQYFAQTEKHREERWGQQQLDAERLNDYVNADHGLYFSHHRSVEPPSEKPWERRQAEMKRLYGNSAPKILAMERLLCSGALISTVTESSRSTGLSFP